LNDPLLLSRRDLLRTLAAAAITAALPCVHPREAVAAAAAKTGGPRPVRWVPGLQLYTLGLTSHDDLAGTFKQLATIGYVEVELAGHYERSASELRAALNDARLTCPASHVSTRPEAGRWDLSGDLSKLASDLKSLGAHYAVVSMPLLPDRIYNVLQHPPAGFDTAAASRLYASLDLDDWKRTADLLNEKGAALASQGLRLAYHNHGLEFIPLPGDTNGLRTLIEHTDPKWVDFQLDIGWAVSARQQLRALFPLLGGRLRLLHLKDVKRPSTSVMDLASTDIGTGIVNWNELVDLVRHSRIEHMFVEQETPFATTPMDAVRVDYAFLTKLFAASAST
jgi:sugar phosphate isomerase/epimerase